MGQNPLGKDSAPEERWAWFMERYTPRMERALYAEAMRIMGSHQDAEDVMQEALIRGATRCWQLRNEARLFQWMFSIVRNIAFDKRKARIKATLSAIELATGIAWRPISLDDRLMSDWQREHLEAAVSRLRSPEKEIIVLKSTTDMKLIEIAAELGLNYHTTRTKYRRTLIKLSNELRDIR